VLLRLGSDIQFVGSPALGGDLKQLREMTKNWLDQQANDVAGVRIERPQLLSQLTESMDHHRFTLIKGLPGTGKTVLLQESVNRSAETGSTLFLSANRLIGNSWIEFANAVGISNAAISPLLVEIEDVIAHHPKVLEVAAIGVPDEKSVEAVKVFIVKSEASLTEQENTGILRPTAHGLQASAAHRIPR